MLGVCIKHALTSSLVESVACWARLRCVLVRNSRKFALLNNVHSIQYSSKCNPLPFGLLAGCCFSKQPTNAEADPIVPVSPVGITNNANYNSGICERLLNQTSECLSINSSVSSGNQGTVNLSIDATHIDNDARSCALGKEFVTSDKTLHKTGSNIEPKTDMHLENKDSICASTGVNASVPLKRLSSETVDYKSKYQKLEEERKELFGESLADQSIVSETNCTVTCDNITDSVLPVVDAEESKNEETSDITKDKRASSKKSKPKQRPNYFVSMKISNPVIRKSLEAVQAHITEQDSRLKPAIVSLKKLHITLMVLHLSDDEEHKKAVEVLERIHKDLNEDMGKHPLTLEFTGLGTFNDKVLFAKVKPGDSLDRLGAIAKDVVKQFEEASLFSTDKKELNPHLTVMKLSRAPKLFHQGIKKIDPVLYGSYKDYVFGSELIKSIELLRMFGPEDEYGYYKGHQLFFGVTEESLPTMLSLSLSDELQDKKDKISQLAQQQVKQMTAFSDVPVKKG